MITEQLQSRTKSNYPTLDLKLLASQPENNSLGDFCVKEWRRVTDRKLIAQLSALIQTSYADVLDIVHIVSKTIVAKIKWLI